MKLLCHWGKVTVPICLPQWMKERTKGVFSISLIKGITFDKKNGYTKSFYSQKNAVLFLFVKIILSFMQKVLAVF